MLGRATLRGMDVSFWLALASSLIGGSGLAVAIMGYLSNRRAIDDAWVREWAAQRPVVYPVLLDDWLAGQGTAYHGTENGRLFPLKNGGRGPALNVKGVIAVTSGDDHEHMILASTIAAGDLLNARLAPPAAAPAEWVAAEGSITCSDLAGGMWEQRFGYTRGPSGELELRLDEPIQTPKIAAGTQNAWRRILKNRRAPTPSRVPSEPERLASGAPNDPSGSPAGIARQVTSHP